MRRLKKYFLTGLLVWLPLAATIWVVQILLQIVDRLAALLPIAYRPDMLLLEAITDEMPQLSWLYKLPIWGLLFTAILVLVTGLITANVFGRRLLKLWEELLNRIPLVRSVYGSVKQVSDTVFSGSGQAFNKALLVQFPHSGSWTIAFQTGVPSEELAAHLEGGFVSVYVPTTPNPTSGYFLIVRKSDVFELDMSVDEALKYVISMGVVAPPDEEKDASC